MKRYWYTYTCSHTYINYISFPSYSNTICNIYDEIRFSNHFYNTVDRILYGTFPYSFWDSPLFNIWVETFYGIYSMFDYGRYPHYCNCTYVEVSSSPLFIFGVMHSTISTVCSRTLRIATTVIVRVAKDWDCHTMNVREVNFSTIITVKLKQIKIYSQIWFQQQE